MVPKFWIGNLLSGLGLTRDSAVLAWSKWIGVCVALAPSVVDTNVVAGVVLPHTVINIVRLTALAVALTSAQHRTSSLAGQ